MAPETLPPEPPVVKLPAIKLPVTFNVPAIFAPVPVTTNVVLPEAVRLILPLLLGILTLLLPLANAPIKLPALKFPVTSKLVSVPTLVILG